MLSGIVSVVNFIELLQFSIGVLDKVPETSDTDWEEMLRTAIKQSLTGVIYNGIEKLPLSQRPPKNIRLGWYMLAEKVKKRNLRLNEMAVKLVKQYAADGFQICILKGQGNALMYPNPLLRVSGDIDIWMRPLGEDVRVKAIRTAVNKYVTDHYANPVIRYYHAEYHVEKISVEAHYLPSIMNNPLYNARLQRYFRCHWNEQYNHWKSLPNNVGQVPVPTDDFNVIFQLCHMMHHYFDEGIGLRQMMDFYYLLKKRDGSRFKNEELKQTLNYLGLWKFARAVMYIMEYVFLLKKDYMIVPIDKKRGESLMKEIIKGGNFGKFSGLTQHSSGSKYMLKNCRSLRLAADYPAEALSEPLFRTWHFFWRLFNK